MRVGQEKIGAVTDLMVTGVEGTNRAEKTEVNEGASAQKQQEKYKEKKYKEEVATAKQDKKEIESKEIIKAIEEANKKIRGDNKEFEFRVHKETKQIMVKVLDTQTHKVIKEFPPEKILDMVANMCELAGLFVDEKR